MKCNAFLIPWRRATVLAPSVALAGAAAGDEGGAGRGFFLRTNLVLVRSLRVHELRLQPVVAQALGSVKRAALTRAPLRLALQPLLGERLPDLRAAPTSGPTPDTTAHVPEPALASTSHVRRAAARGGPRGKPPPARGGGSSASPCRGRRPGRRVRQCPRRSPRPGPRAPQPAPQPPAATSARPRGVRRPIKAASDGRAASQDAKPRPAAATDTASASATLARAAGRAWPTASPPVAAARFSATSSSAIAAAKSPAAASATPLR
jgi:hypothetical protein